MRKMFSETKEYKSLIISSVIGTIFAALADLAMPMLLALMIKNGISAGSREYIFTIGKYMVLVAVFSLGGAILSSYNSAKFGTALSYKLRDKIFRKVQTFGIAELQEIGTASLITRNTNDVQQIQMFFVMLVRMFVRAPILLVFGSIMSIRQSPRLARPLIVSIPILAIIIFAISRFIVPRFRVIQRKVDDVNRVLREQITGIRVVRAFGTEEYETERFDKISKDHAKISRKMMRIMSLMNPLMTIVMNLTIVAVILVGANQVNIGALTDNGVIVAVIQYNMQIMFSLVMMTMIFVMYPRAVASADRINEVLEKEPKIVDLKKTVTPDEKTKGELEFRNVGFCFDGAEKSCVSHVSFKANKGDKIAIIGGTGSGKSTILRLIMRFYDVSQGSILLDGVDVREMAQEDLRSRISYITQTTELFSGTIEDNLRYGKDNATLEEMQFAAKTAQALRFIENEDGKFKAHVAQDGTNFSGGQKQRLSISRALVRKPEILLFDDSFSALDAATDLKLRQAIDKEFGDTTQIVVAQRVSSIADADLILVLENGVIVGQGLHEELLKTCNVYKEIADSQFSLEEVAG